MEPDKKKAMDASVAALLTDIKVGDAAVRGRAVLKAPLAGTPAIVPLGQVLVGADLHAARAAEEALRRIVYHAGRPGAKAERVAASAELCKLLEPSTPRRARAEALYLLGILGDPGAVRAIVACLGQEDVREDARMALQRVPGREAKRALDVALAGATGDYRLGLVGSLKARAGK